jgi:hypothetical protein
MYALNVLHVLSPITGSPSAAAVLGRSKMLISVVINITEKPIIAAVNVRLGPVFLKTFKLVLRLAMPASRGGSSGGTVMP